MTGQQIYELASSFLYEIDGEDEDSKRFAVGFINILLQETLACENSIRECESVEILKEAPYITSLTDEIPYSPQLTRVALPYGVASWFFRRLSITSRPRTTAANISQQSRKRPA